MAEAKVQTAFDLDAAVAAWRLRLAQGEAVSRDAVDELEDHLRREHEALASGSLSGEEAFAVASLRCGAADRLGAEYAKGNAAAVWMRRVAWMLAGYFVCLGLAGAVDWVIGLATVVSMGFGLGISWTVLIFCVVTSSAIAAGLAGLGLVSGGRPERLFERLRLPGWMTRRPWAAALLVMVLVPWFAVAQRLVQAVVMSRALTVEQWGRAAMAESIFSIVLPAVGPVVLFALAWWLHAGARRPAVA
ncbi:MAG: hypothetical protein AAF823_15195 [Planctomycetota bacterium]